MKNTKKGKNMYNNLDIDTTVFGQYSKKSIKRDYSKFTDEELQQQLKNANSLEASIDYSNPESLSKKHDIFIIRESVRFERDKRKLMPIYNNLTYGYCVHIPFIENKKMGDATIIFREGNFFVVKPNNLVKIVDNKKHYKIKSFEIYNDIDKIEFTKCHLRYMQNFKDKA